jgi:hypothetical protein
MSNVLVMFTYGSGEAEALASRFAEDKIPNLAAGLSAVASMAPIQATPSATPPFTPTSSVCSWIGW